RWDANVLFSEVYFRTPRIGYVGAVIGLSDPGSSYGRLYTTTDSGITWDSLDIDGVPLGINFITEKIGYVLGTKGLFMKTTDGGETWNREYVEPYFTNDEDVTFTHIHLLPDG